MKGLILGTIGLILGTPALADYNYIELGAGFRTHGDSWTGDIPASFEVGRHFTLSDNIYLRSAFNHTSNLDKGKPLNNDYETQINWVFLKLGFTF